MSREEFLTKRLAERGEVIERLTEALTMIANPDGLASRADNFMSFAQEYQKYALDIARTALDHASNEDET